MKHRYLVALGSNMRHHRLGGPERVLAAAMDALDAMAGMKVTARSPVIRTAPLGPSRRRFANAAVLVKTRREPEDLLAALKALERGFGRPRRGPRWVARVLDCDVVLWDGGCWESGSLVIPHPAFRTRDFVLRPAEAVAASWRDPVSGLSLRHLRARLTRPVPVRIAPTQQPHHRAWGP